MDNGQTRAAGRRGIQSVEIGFSVLRAMLEAGRPLPLKTLSRLSGVQPSRLHSYLVSFVAVGVARQDRDTGHYGLGPFALELGIGMLEQFDHFSAAQAAMRELADQTGFTVFLGVWGNHGPTIVSRVDGALTQAVLDIRVGSVLPVLRSAVGRNLAAHVPETASRPLIAAELEASRAAAGEQPDSLEEPKTFATVETILAAARRDGIARARGGLLSDYTALSSPIFDFAGTIYGALTIMGRITLFDDSFDGEPARQLKQACQAISRAAGHFDRPARQEALGKVALSR